MNNVEELKQKAVEYAKRFYIDDYELKNEDIKTYNAEQWYIVLNLSQIYLNLMKNIITRQKAKEEQVKVFDYVIKNKVMFEDYNNG